MGICYLFILFVFLEPDQSQERVSSEDDEDDSKEEEEKEDDAEEPSFVMGRGWGLSGTAGNTVHCFIFRSMKVFHLSQAEPIGVRCICLTVNDLHDTGPRDTDREMPNKRFFLNCLYNCCAVCSKFALKSQP